MVHRSLLLLPLLLAACCPAPKDDTQPAFPNASAQPSSLPPAEDPVVPISVEMAANRGEYKGAAQILVTRYDNRVQAASARLQKKPEEARALNEAHWELVRSFKAIESSDEASFPAARERFEAAAKDLDKKLASVPSP